MFMMHHFQVCGSRLVCPCGGSYSAARAGAAAWAPSTAREQPPSLLLTPACPAADGYIRQSVPPTGDYSGHITPQHQVLMLPDQDRWRVVAVADRPLCISTRMVPMYHRQVFLPIASHIARARPNGPGTSLLFRTSLRERWVSFRGRHASPSSSSLSLRSRRWTLAGLPRGFAPLDDWRFSVGCEVPVRHGAHKLQQLLSTSSWGHVQSLNETQNRTATGVGLNCL